MKIPFWENKNIRIYYILTLLNNAWFIMGNWIFFWSLFMSYKELGVIDAAGFGFGMLMEIPTGAIADLIGKKRTIILSFLLTSIGILIMSEGIDFTNMLIGFLITQLGWALYSGSGEALAYDSLVDIKQEDHYDKVISTASSMGTIFTAITSLIGIYIYQISPSLPHLIWGIFNIFAFIVAFFLTEPFSDTEKFTFKTYIFQLKQGFKHIFSKRLRVYFIFFVVIAGVVNIYDWGLLKPVLATENGFLSTGQGIIFAVANLIAGFSATLVPLIRKKFKDFKGLTILGLIMGLIWIVFSFKLGGWMAIVFFAISFIGGISYPWISTIVNKEIPSKDRSTTISTMALISSTPYVLIAIVAGNLIDQGKLNYLTIGIAVLIFVGIGLNIIFKKQSDRTDRGESIVHIK